MHIAQAADLMVEVSRSDSDGEEGINKMLLNMVKTMNIFKQQVEEVGYRVFSARCQ